MCLCAERHVRSNYYLQVAARVLRTSGVRGASWPAAWARAGPRRAARERADDNQSKRQTIGNRAPAQPENLKKNLALTGSHVS